MLSTAMKINRSKFLKLLKEWVVNLERKFVKNAKKHLT